MSKQGVIVCLCLGRWLQFGYIVVCVAYAKREHYLLYLSIAFVINTVFPLWYDESMSPGQFAREIKISPNRLLAWDTAPERMF